MTVQFHNLAQILSWTSADYPDEVALRYRGESMTYGELNRLANQFAAILQRVGVTPGERIGLIGFKSPQMVAAMQGILRADCVYVPLDSRAPEARLASICADCGIRTVIVDKASQRHSEELVRQGMKTFISLSDDCGLPSELQVYTWSDVIASSDKEQSGLRGGKDLAYMLYTSGSTGKPKGVMISHENALTFIHWAHKHFQVERGERLLNHAPLTFDLPVFDLYNGFLAVAAVVLLPETDALFPAAVVQTIKSEAVTSLYMVPSVYGTLMSRGGLLDLDSGQFRRMMYSGEAFAVPALRKLREWYRGPVCNLYGPIETNACTYHDVVDADLEYDSIPIGQPIANVRVSLRDTAGKEVPFGEVGEIWVTGGCVTLGYWGNDELNDYKLCRDKGDVFFRTGDLAHQDSEGRLWFHGRQDYLVKSRGFRIELGEIEHALLSQPGVLEAAVAAVPDPDIGNTLHGWFVPATQDITASQVKKGLAGILPSYMHPQTLEPMQALPRTLTGKTSRKELVAMLLDKPA